MKRSIALLVGLALLVGADAVLARNGGGHSGGSHGGGFHSGGFHGVVTPGGGRPGMGAVHAGPVVGVHPGPIVGVRPGPIFGVRPPVFIGRPPFFHGHHGGGTVIVAAPFYGYPYYPYYPYYPSAYPAPVYSEPTYIEQGSDIHYYCPDYRDYYPNVASCPSAWMQVLPDGRVVSP